MTDMRIEDTLHNVKYIPVDTSKVPYSFSIKLEDRTFTFTIKYNTEGLFFTVDLAVDSTKEVLCYGDPIRYGRPLFGSIEDERFPVPVIIPYALKEKETEVNKDNLGRTVQLYIHERR